MAQNGHRLDVEGCPLSGVKRTSPFDYAASAFDPKRSPQFLVERGSPRSTADQALKRFDELESGDCHRSQNVSNCALGSGTNRSCERQTVNFQ